MSDNKILSDLPMTFEEWWQNRSPNCETYAKWAWDEATHQEHERCYNIIAGLTYEIVRTSTAHGFKAVALQALREGKSDV